MPGQEIGKPNIIYNNLPINNYQYLQSQNPKPQVVNINNPNEQKIINQRIPLKPEIKQMEPQVQVGITIPMGNSIKPVSFPLIEQVKMKGEKDEKSTDQTNLKQEIKEANYRINKLKEVSKIANDVNEEMKKTIEIGKVNYDRQMKILEENKTSDSPEKSKNIQINELKYVTAQVELEA